LFLRLVCNSLLAVFVAGVFTSLLDAVNELLDGFEWHFDKLVGARVNKELAFYVKS